MNYTEHTNEDLSHNINIYGRKKYSFLLYGNPRIFKDSRGSLDN